MSSSTNEDEQLLVQSMSAQSDLPDEHVLVDKQLAVQLKGDNLITVVEDNVKLRATGAFPPPPKQSASASINDRSNDVEFGSHDTTEDPDALMIGVEIFEESDIDTDADNKLQLYSDVDAAVDSDALIDATPGVSLEKGPAVKTKRKTKKALREPSRLSLEERIKCIRMCSRYNSYADAQKAWRQTYDTEPPCRKTMSTLDKKFQKTGSVADLTRTGRPKSTRTEAVIARVEEAVSKDPSKSIRTLAKELGINQASVHRIKKEFEDKRNTLKMENRKLRDKLNDALKRVVILEKRLTQTQNGVQTEMSSTALLQGGIEPKYETLVITAPDGSGTSGLASFSSDHLDHNGSNIPTIIALNNSNSQVLRLPPGQETIHIITLPQGSSHHQVLSLDDSASFQLSIPSTSPSVQMSNVETTGFLTTTSSSSNNHENVASSFVSFK